MSEGEHLGALVHDVVEVGQVEATVLGHVEPPQRCPGAAAEFLPRDEVGVVLHLGDEDLVTGAQRETVTVTAGGEAIKVVATGDQRIVSISLKPEVVDPEDVEMLQDLLVAAVNQALEESQAMAGKRMSALTGGLSLPGLF